jgi:ubiquinol-cytochrome c reductase cytochrome b subunit
MGRFGDWLDSRTGFRKITHDILMEPVRGGARWAYIFGSVLTFLLVLQAVTGVLLASFYAPSATTAWASVAFIQDQLTMGWFIRGLHSMGASAMVVLCICHIGQVMLYGAYKAPRELNWLLGVAMFGMVLAFALTGYLLPWDQKGYWATQVATSIIGTTPLVGHKLQELLQGGASYGNYTLTHFYALHTYVLPGLIFVFLAGHLFLFRKHGITPRWNMSEEEVTRRTVPFWPNQLFRDMVGCAAVFVIMCVLVVRSHGAELEAPADPSSSYVARPEWYFLPLFQLLKYFEGPAEIIGTLVIPGLVGLFLAVLPFADRVATRQPGKRLRFLVPAVAGLVSVIALGMLASRTDAKNPEYVKQRGEAKEQAELARNLAKRGVPAEGGLGVFKNDPQFAAREIWTEKCAGCHSLSGTGGEKGPDLKGWGSRQWLTEFMHNPDAPTKMGPCKLEKGMKPVKASDEDIAALVEFVYAQSGAPDVDAGKADKGKALLSDLDCDSCHEIDGTSSGQGPNLGGHGTPDYVRAIIRDASAANLFGKRNRMPKFEGKLTAEQIEALARLVLGQSGSTASNAATHSPAR